VRSEAFGEHLPEAAEAVLEEGAGVGAVVEDFADEVGEGGARRVGAAPEGVGGEREGAGGIGVGFELEDEEEAVDDDEPFGPEVVGEGLAIGVGENGGVGGVVEDALEEAFDGAAGLEAELAGDGGLSEPSGLDEVGEGAEAGGGRRG
jgi:hypothetical protein